MPEQSLILWIIGAILTVTGLAGMLLPFVPGAPFLFLGLLFGAWADDFRYIGIGTLLILAGMAALTYLVDFATTILGVKKYGGSRRAMLGAALGGIVGIFLGIPGILFGPFVGAVLGELSLQRPVNPASRAGFCPVVGPAGVGAGNMAPAPPLLGLFLFARLY